MVSQDEVWNTLPLFILFREAIEASIIVTVLISFVRRMNAPHLEKQVWLGVGLAAATSIILGIIFISVYYTASQNLFQGRNQLIFKTAVSWVASSMITLLAFAMLRFMGWEDKWQRKLKVLADQRMQAQAAALAAKEAALAETGNSGSGSSELSSGAQAAAAGSSSSDSDGKPVGGAPEVTVTACDSAEGSRRGWWDPRGWAEAARAKRQRRQAVAAGPQDSPIEAEVKEKWTSKYNFFIAVFFTVLREGLESVVFLAGVGNTIPSAIVLPGVIGIMCGACFGIILYFSGKSVRDIKWLFIVMSIVLFFIAAGQAEAGAGWLMQAGGFGTYYAGVIVPVDASAAASAVNDGDETLTVSDNFNDGYSSIDLRPWWMRPLWDVSGCCADTDEKNKFLALMKAIFGYVAQPTFVHVMSYCGYWILAILFACYKFHIGTLFDADYKHNRVLRRQAEEAEAASEAAARARAKAKALEHDVAPAATA